MIYTVQAIPSDGMWFMPVPELDCATQALHLEEVEVMARSLISLMSNTSYVDVQVVIDIAVGPIATELLRSLAAAGDPSDAALQTPGSLEHDCLKELVGLGVRTRDIAMLIGVRHSVVRDARSALRSGHNDESQFPPPPRRCPNCEAVAGVMILRGYPSQEANEAIMAGTVDHRGCLVGPDGNDWMCRVCGHEWR